MRPNNDLILARRKSVDRLLKPARRWFTSGGKMDLLPGNKLSRWYDRYGNVSPAQSFFAPLLSNGVVQFRTASAQRFDLEAGLDFAGAFTVAMVCRLPALGHTDPCLLWGKGFADSDPDELATVRDYALEWHSGDLALELFCNINGVEQQAIIADCPSDSLVMITTTVDPSWGALCRVNGAVSGLRFTAGAIGSDPGAVFSVGGLHDFNTGNAALAADLDLLELVMLDGGSTADVLRLEKALRDLYLGCPRVTGPMLLAKSADTIAFTQPELVGPFPSQAYVVENCGNAALSYRASVSQAGVDALVFDAAPAYGTLQPGESVTLTISILHNGFFAGAHFDGTLHLTNANDGNGNTDIPLTLDIT